MKLSALIQKLTRNYIKLTEVVYHTEGPRNVHFSEHVYFVQICPVFAGPVTFYVGVLCLKLT